MISGGGSDAVLAESDLLTLAIGSDGCVSTDSPVRETEIRVVLNDSAIVADNDDIR